MDAQLQTTLLSMSRDLGELTVQVQAIGEIKDSIKGIRNDLKEIYVRKSAIEVLKTEVISHSTDLRSIKSSIISIDERHNTEDKIEEVKNNSSLWVQYGKDVFKRVIDISVSAFVAFVIMVWTGRKI